MEYVLVIPSHKRPRILFEKTYYLLKKTHAIEPIIWLNDDDDIDEYKIFIPHGIYKRGGNSIKEKRILIQEYFPIDTKIVMIDDDIKNIYVYDSDTKTNNKLKDFNTLVNIAFTQLEKQQSHIWGVYPIHNPFFMKPVFRTNLCYIIAALFGVINKRIPTETNYAEDFERSILHYQMDKKLLRLEFVGLDTNYYTEPGGLQETRTEKKNYDDKKILADKYSDLCVLKYKRERAEIVFKRTKPSFIDYVNKEI